MPHVRLGLACTDHLVLHAVGPIYYDIVKPGEVFARTTGKVWFTIEVRLHLGPASEYSKWSVGEYIELILIWTHLTDLRLQLGQLYET
jgi:hypothetical protein